MSSFRFDAQFAKNASWVDYVHYLYVSVAIVGINCLFKKVVFFSLSSIQLTLFMRKIGNHFISIMLMLMVVH